MNGVPTYLALALSLLLTSSVTGTWRLDERCFPASARAIDIKAAEVLPAPRRCCGGTAWYPAGLRVGVPALQLPIDRAQDRPRRSEHGDHKDNGRGAGAATEALRQKTRAEHGRLR
jgi:hypothetical protein